ncbi:MAG: NAD-dependent epimerase/dehydratase family protein [Clostridia bacterium]|nr:NAD-dependent epimerase/dehydratase family protein [Clostridia bacterium]
MNILITGARGFVGKNLSHALENIKLGKDRSYGELSIGELYLYDVDSSKELLDTACKNADFVFNLAGVNRPREGEKFESGNEDFADLLISLLKKHENKCPVMFSSSVQASLVGRYNGDYGRSKKNTEEKFFEYQTESGAEVLVYRFPNLFGKWCRPSYNSVIATFCYNIANSLPIRVDNEEAELTLLYIDDLVDEMIGLLLGKRKRCDYDVDVTVLSENGKFCYTDKTHNVKLGKIASLLLDFDRETLLGRLPLMQKGSFESKLYSTYLSYLPKEKTLYPIESSTDERGSFTELIKGEHFGQISVNRSKPGAVKGNHWHNSKWEIFIVISGRARIDERKLDSDEIISFEVSGERLEAVRMLPGYTHSITNLSDSEELVTLMFASEPFDKEKPDTFYEETYINGN